MDFEIIRQPTAVWEFDNPTLLANQIGVCSDIRNGVETDTGLAKLGNSVDDWDTLGYFSPSDSAVWGEITGTLSDQTDLQSALDLKAPLSPTVREVSGTTGTITQSDNGKIISCTQGTDPVTLTLTAPISAGFNCIIIQSDDQVVTVADDATAAINNRQSQFNTAGQYAVVSIVATANNVCVLAGDTA